MLTMYVILDGFDLGAGIVHLFVARNNEERRTVLNAIGPVWDGNEVWLIAAGGTLYFAFPLLYASSFSGFYLPLIIVLWLLMLRGLGIELRHHVDNHLWKSFWDGSFALGSTLLALFLGAALGNVIRGVPLNADGYFFAPLWTSFTVQPEAGVLDWFTVLMGLVGLSTLTAHGTNYLALKTTGEVHHKSRRINAIAVWVTAALSAVALAAASTIRPELWDNYGTHWWGILFPAAGIAGMTGMVLYNKRKDDLKAFLSSSLFIAGMMSGTAFAMFPNVLPASTNPAYGLTVYNTTAGAYGLGVGVIWWSIGMVLAFGYFGYIFYSFRGKVTVNTEGY